MCQLIFDEESIYEISNLYLIKFCYGRTDGRTDGRAESNIDLFQSWGHKNGAIWYILSVPKNVIINLKNNNFREQINNPKGVGGQ